PGGCINSSPAGKRRIQIGAEQALSQLGVGAFGAFGQTASTFLDPEAKGFLNHLTSPQITIAALTVAALLLIICIILIVTVVKKNSYHRYTGIKYNKLSQNYQKTVVRVPVEDTMVGGLCHDDDDEEDEEEADGEVTLYRNT
uniref:Uncharacterized protein n=1 Tax=Phlebotomus papatasi TaxID=29031 RepID=A0A1B0D9G3_PHLPP